jgi:peptidoglycan/xylan/chitin deacetylase (PgdA/CDA1 family)
MMQMNIPFTLFITPSFLNMDGYMSIEQVIEVSKSHLCTIGYHTHSHPLLRKMDYSEAYYEIVTSKKKFENETNIKIKIFAYPYGSYLAVKKSNIKMVCMSNYDYGFSTIKGRITRSKLKGNKKFFLPRTNVDEILARKIIDEKK